MSDCCCSGSEQQGRPSGGRIFLVEGLCCAEEVRLLKDSVGPVVGDAEALRFDVMRGRLTLPDDATASDERIMAAIAAAGLRGSRVSSEDEAVGTPDRRPLYAAIASGSAILLALVWHVFESWQGGLASVVGGHADGLPWPELTLYVLAIVVGGIPVARKAWISVKRLSADMHLLMTVAVIGAMILGEWLEAALVVALFTLSLALESWSVGRARRAVEGLLDLRPDTARVAAEDGRWIVTAVADVPVGATVQVRAGDRVPLDGEIRTGRSSIDEAAVTGESVPASKGQGDRVYAGTVNLDGTLTLATTQPAGQTLLARIMRQVAAAQSNRAAAEQWIERFARCYTPGVLGAAVLTAIALPLLFAWPITDAIYSALVLLVIACPCALVISTPVSIVAGLAACARQGVLVKGGRFLELSGRLRSVAFDKTGTLTRGRHSVEAVIPVAGHGREQVLRVAGALAADSTHPLSAAIHEVAATGSLVRTAVGDLETVPGRGVTGTLGGERAWLGAVSYVAEQCGGRDLLEAAASEHEARGRSVVAVARQSGPLGVFALSDRVRSGAGEALRELADLGIDERLMVTGDKRATANGVAGGLGLTGIEAELLPEDKVAVVARLADSHGPVAFVGDGVNDAPAMARADLGIAMGALGSDVAIETADVALMADELERLPWLVRHARRTLGIIRQNVVLALGAKGIMAVLTFAGIASLWGAIAADVGMALLVVLNALRLLRAGADTAAGPSPQAATSP